MAFFQSPYDALVERQKTLNSQQNPALRKARGMINFSEEMPGALTSAGVPDMLEGRDNKEFWDNNETLRAMEDPGSGAWRRSTGNLKGGVGTIGGGGMGGFDSLRSMSSYGNVNNGPSSLERDLGSEALHSARLRNYEMAKGPETRTGEAVSRQQALDRARIETGTEATKAGAQTYFDPTVQRMMGDDAQRSVDQMYAKFVEPARLRAEGEAEKARITAEGGLNKERLRGMIAQASMLMSSLGRAGTAEGFDDDAKQRIREYFDMVKQMGIDAGIIQPQGLIPTPNR